MSILFGVKCVIVFKKNGLNEDWIREELSKYGEIFAVQEDSLVGEDLDGNEIDEPVKMFYIDTDLGKFMRLKLDFNCVSTEENAYVLLPMINYEEKRKMMEIRAGK